MPHDLQGACFNCGATIDATPSREDSFALYTSKVEFYSPRGLRIRSSVVRRLVCTDCAEFAESHPVRFPSATAQT